jgi:MOSC domain-containing protein YiiM
MSGSVEGIFTASSAGQPMTELREAKAVAGRGLEGDRYSSRTGYYSETPSPGGGRELTLIEVEVLESLAAERGIELAPRECRRNVVTRGVRLPELIGKRFRVGEVLCEGVRICEPCVYLEQLTGKPVNEPLVHRGGLRANILEGGTLEVGDIVEGVGDEVVPPAPNP